MRSPSLRGAYHTSVSQKFICPNAINIYGSRKAIVMLLRRAQQEPIPARAIAERVGKLG